MIVASILSPLENVMKAVLTFFHDSAGLSWAWSIVALTIVVRVLLVPVMVKQIHSMQAMQKHAPEIKEIQKKYKGDRQKMNEEVMKLYKEHSINPAASCLPMLLQLPIFFALYLTLRHASSKHSSLHISGSWLHVVPNITAHPTAHWSGYVLVAIYVGSQIASTFYMGTQMDKTQRTIFMILPLVMITVVLRFPIGLLMYWMTTNLWTVGQGLITRTLMPTRTPAPAFGARAATGGASRKPSADGGKAVAASAEPAPAPTPKPKPKPAASQAPRQVRRKKGGGRR
jgi:YidC/Oxa1 family membrane protein insertase